MKTNLKIYLVAGARPNFMKIAPLWEEMQKYPEAFDTQIIHTGQHYGENMSDIFFKQLGIPEPHICFNVGSGTHAEQTSAIMLKFERLCIQQRPDIIMVVGDVNSTVACALVGAKLNIRTAHIEAGLRSGDRAMPEEVNRLVTDAISDMLFTTCRDADENLQKEGIPERKIHFVGNTMIDTLFKFKKLAETESKLNVRAQSHALLTLHRPSNVDDRETFGRILAALSQIAKEVPLIFPAHPRTAKQIKACGYEEYFNVLNPDSPDIVPKNAINILPPVSYIDMLKLMKTAALVLTDSGGLQEETTGLGIPCLTLRENTERPVTITEGTNILVGTDGEKIIREGLNILNTGGKKGAIPHLWDGRASSRIINAILAHFNLQPNI